MAEAVVGRKARVRAPVQDDSGSRNPVSLFAVDEVTDDVEGAEAIRPFGSTDPWFGQPVEQGRQCPGCTPEHLERPSQFKFHGVPMYRVSTLRQSTAPAGHFIVRRRVPAGGSRVPSSGRTRPGPTRQSVPTSP